MVPETAWPAGAPPAGVHYTGYRQQRRAGFAARFYQVLHILTRPFSLTVSAALARAFNRHLMVDPAQLQAGLSRVADGDRVLWLNPSLALQDVLDGLQKRPVELAFYFLDPVHRLGWHDETVRQWAKRCRVASYWPAQAQLLGMQYRPPYSPAVPRQAVSDSPAQPGQAQPARRELDLVYVGSPSPKRLLWVLRLNGLMRRGGRRGFLRLASRQPVLHRLWPAVFGPRVSFEAYAALCARSQAVLELHERDAGGVTLRATLCDSLQAVHVSNQASTPQTLQVSWWNLQPLARFLADQAAFPASAPALKAPPIGDWLPSHFEG